MVEGEMKKNLLLHFLSRTHVQLFSRINMLLNCIFSDITTAVDANI